jgi:prophage antirepressor-like protein
MDLDIESSVIKLDRHDISFIVVDGQPWFRGKELSMALGYVRPMDAVADHVDAEHKKTRADLMSRQSVATMTSPLSYNEARMIWVDEAGMYSLIMASKLPQARAFKEWVTAEVLPTIRRQGSYFREPVAAQLSDWEQRRVDSIAVHKILSDCIKKALEQVPSNVMDARMYAIINNSVNKALLDFDGTTAKFLKDRGAPRNMSVPKLCNAQLLRNLISIQLMMCTTVENDIDILATMTRSEFEKWLEKTCETMIRVAGELGWQRDAQSKLLDMPEAVALDKKLTSKRRVTAIGPSPKIAGIESCPPPRRLVERRRVLK